MKEIFDELIEEIKEIVNSSLDTDSKLRKICILLKERIYYYNWVGFYFVRDDKLVLGPFSGEETEHKIIPFGSGICGQAAKKMDTFIVQDVSKEKNYLACSSKVKAEIVVPIIKNGKFFGEIDIDSHYVSPFKNEDKEFLEEVCKIISKII